ncbi:hypothetical protein HK105_204077 [Polyrhizophydium stewartii]|uniref:Zinc finger C2H2 LYAR-type domain-containing protein n=1 Tax=Polyrhizophydium stewartii TaxID=2732419 RepID=A0ABR4NA43_9FUNG
MVSFVCEVCQETIKKPKLDQHFYRCPDAYFSCVDCSTTFQGTEYRDHKSCISEAEKYQKSLYKAPKGKQQQQQPPQQVQKQGQQQKKHDQQPAPQASAKQNIVKPPTGESLISQIKKTEAAAKPAQDTKPDDAAPEVDAADKKSKKKDKRKAAADDEPQAKKAKGPESEAKAGSGDADAIKSAVHAVLTKVKDSQRKKVAKKLAKKLDGLDEAGILARIDSTMTFSLTDGAIAVTFEAADK